MINVLKDGMIGKGAVVASDNLDQLLDVHSYFLWSEQWLGIRLEVLLG